ncbi:ENG1 Endo-1 [Candida maltosa Xu316]
MQLRSILLASLLTSQISAQILKREEILTVTKTTYVSDSCLENFAKEILPNNPTGLTTGIPIVIVYAPKSTSTQDDNENNQVHTTTSNTNHPQQQQGQHSQQQQSQPSQSHNQQSTGSIQAIKYTTAVTSATSCNGDDCTVHSFTTVIPVNEKTSANSNSETTPSLKTTSVKTAPTTTSTIFSASSSPSTTFTPSTKVTPVPTTARNPVSSQSVVSSSKSKSIDTSTITGPVTIKAESTASNSQTISKSSSLNNSTSNAHDETESAGSSLSNSQTVLSSLESTLSSSLLSSSSIESISSVSGYTNSTTVGSSSTAAGSSSTTVGSSSTTVGSSSSTVGSSSSLSSESSSSESSTVTASTSSEESATATNQEVPITPPTCYSGDLFSVIDTSDPRKIFPAKQLPLAIPAGVNNNGAPIGTNKFYTNLVIGDQDFTIYPLPYGLYWSKTKYYGFGIQHFEAKDRTFGNGPTNNVGVPTYYLYGTQIAELLLSATSFGQDSTFLKVTDMTDLSALASLSSSANDENNHLDIPLVQGMGFVTGVYNGNLKPLINSIIGFKTLTLETSDALLSNILKYRVTLYNDVQWLVYITLPSANTDFELQVQGSDNIQGSKSVDGLIIQVAVAPQNNADDKYYDAAAGMYVTSASVSGTVTCDTAANYKITYETSGKSSSGNPIIFALPHHIPALTGSTLNAATGLNVQSTTKGQMSGFLSNVLEFTETIAADVEFLPWVPGMNGPLTYTEEQLVKLASSANVELSVDIAKSVNEMNSTYFSGKVIDKYAQILLVVSEIIQDEDVTRDTLEAMKDAFDVFIENKQYYPFMYDTKFGGVTSTSAQNGDTGADFGAAYYNDHDFHYGYFIHAAAIVGYIDTKLNGTWVEDNKDWVNALVRDTSNPSKQDTYFPVSRSFDWYSGHSWAAGLFSTMYKNIESSSESLHHAAAIKLWGKVVGDKSMESRGGLMLAIMARSYNDYFYFKSDNQIQPSQILPNKVSGIFFENKVEYTTFFGNPADFPQYVHGIHMLPMTPSTALARIPSYVQEEWNEQISTFIGNVTDVWLGILRLNQALIDPKASYDFFASDSFKDDYLDNGQSRTWSLAFSGVYNSL